MPVGIPAAAEGTVGGVTNAIIDINLICQLVKRILIVFCMLVVSAICAGANIDMPCVGTATAVLNVRSGPGTGYSRVGLLSDGETIHVRKWANADWLEVEYNGRVAYVHSDYVELSPSPVKSSNTVRKKKHFLREGLLGYLQRSSIAVRARRVVGHSA